MTILRLLPKKVDPGTDRGRDPITTLFQCSATFAALSDFVGGKSENVSQGADRSVGSVRDVAKTSTTEP